LNHPNIILKIQALGLIGQLDNLCLHKRGWRRFKWERCSTKNIISFTYLPEHEGHITFTGKYSPKIAGLPDTVSVFIYRCRGKISDFQVTLLLASGYIRFNVEKNFMAAMK